jgi:hypothetical protein
VIDAFKTILFLYKRRKIKTSFTQYFYGTLSGKFGTEKRREHAAFSTRPTYNWLEEKGKHKKLFSKRLLLLRGFCEILH